MMKPGLRAVLEPRFLRKLDRTRLRVRHATSMRPGNTPVPRATQTSGIEVAGHKPYYPGDDLRHIDWNALSRLDQLMVRTFRAEREAAVHLFVDTSASMDAPRDDDKFGFAQALAASLTYLALRRHDPVRIIALGESLPQEHVASPVFRHVQRLPSAIEFIAALRPSGGTALRGGVAGAMQTYHTPGIAVLISDFLMAPSQYEPTLGELVARQFTLAVVRLLGPAERDPGQYFKRVEIIDAEAGAKRWITLDERNRERYATALDQHLADLSDTCRRVGALFSTSDPAGGLENCVFGDLSRIGLVV